MAVERAPAKANLHVGGDPLPDDSHDVVVTAAVGEPSVDLDVELIEAIAELARMSTRRMRLPGARLR